MVSPQSLCCKPPCYTARLSHEGGGGWPTSENGPGAGTHLSQKWVWLCEARLNSLEEWQQVLFLRVHCDSCVRRVAMESEGLGMPSACSVDRTAAASSSFPCLLPIFPQPSEDGLGEAVHRGSVTVRAVAPCEGSLLQTHF